MAAVTQAIRGRVGSLVDDLGRVFGLMFAVLVRIPRRPWRPRAVAEQIWFIASVTLFPALLLTLSFGLVIGLQVYNITRQFGADSAQGAAMVLAIVRETGPLGTTFMLAAAGGTAITADLGSRTVRDEIAAMRVMAVDPLHRARRPPRPRRRHRRRAHDRHRHHRRHRRRVLLRRGAQGHERRAPTSTASRRWPSCPTSTWPWPRASCSASWPR